MLPPKYLQYFPKPLLHDLIHGRWLPVVGAGMSLNAKVSGDRRLLLWGDLGKALEGDLEDFASNGPIDALSAYEHQFGRAKLVERLTELLLVREASPGPAHKEFCSLPFDIVCTTNFDFLLEQQYASLPRYVHPVLDEEQLSLPLPQVATLLLKIHGDMHHPGRLIVSEADYDGFLAKYPLLATFLANLLITKTAILVGYSLDDPDFRQVWHIIGQRLGKARRLAYAIMVGAKQSDVSRFERRGVRVINLPGPRERYGEVLAATFNELGEYLREQVISSSTVKEERPLRELQLPRDATNRLCFFSLPVEHLPIYREWVFPAVEDAGFVPITADDVLAPGGSISAKIDALIDRAAIVVVHPATASTQAELLIARAKLKLQEVESSPIQRKRFGLIVLASSAEHVDIDRGVISLFQSPDWMSDPSAFAEALVRSLRNVLPEAGLDLFESERLFQAREYRAAVIAAMTILESFLRAKLGKEITGFSYRPPTLRLLAKHAADRLLISIELLEKIEGWTKSRNRAVHSTGSISRAVAKEIVEGVTSIVNSF